MPASQFTIFSSSDVGGPGLLTGQAGSLLTLLDSCLVTGYSGHSVSPAWTKPFANSGNIGCYKQGAGAGLGLVINDNGPNVTSTYKEAWAIGWESVAGIGAPVGTGSGQFPTPAQALTTGHLVVRKSATADSTTRAWTLFADASTMYLFIANADAAGAYSLFGFGDIFSLKGASDVYRCFIFGRNVENYGPYANAAVLAEIMDALPVMDGNANTFSKIPGSSSAFNPKFMARSYGGGGTSIIIQLIGDMIGTVSGGAAGYFYPLQGGIQTPNGPDNSLYLSPLRVGEVAAQCVRGRFRGLYQVCHPIAGFADGQTFSGGGDFAGKTFQIVKQGFGGGFWAVETSATVETN